VREAEREQRRAGVPARRPPLDPQFKLVFLTAAIGTFFFIALCVVLTLASGREPHPPLEKLVTGILDMAKIGFGAVVGLLGGKSLRRRRRHQHHGPGADPGHGDDDDHEGDDRSSG
jgi:hypothetical protein